MIYEWKFTNSICKKIFCVMYHGIEFCHVLNFEEKDFAKQRYINCCQSCARHRLYSLHSSPSATPAVLLAASMTADPVTHLLDDCI